MWRQTTPGGGGDVVLQPGRVWVILMRTAHIMDGPYCVGGGVHVKKRTCGIAIFYESGTYASAGGTSFGLPL